MTLGTLLWLRAPACTPFPKRQKGGTRHRSMMSMMSSTHSLVCFGREASFSSLRWATWTARSDGTRVNRETTSKEIMVSSLVSLSDLMKSTNSLEFFTWELVLLTTGCSRFVRNFDGWQVWDDTKDTMGRGGAIPIKARESCQLNFPASSTHRCEPGPSNQGAAVKNSSSSPGKLQGLVCSVHHYCGFALVGWQQEDVFILGHIPQCSCLDIRYNILGFISNYSDDLSDDSNCLSPLAIFFVLLVVYK